MTSRSRVLQVCGGLCILRLALFMLIWLYNNTADAQWQLAYLPFLAIDFPVSLFYTKLPVPIPEGLIGPMWWFLMPLSVWWLIWGRRKPRPQRSI
jgi:hypothetical protein